MAAEPKKIKGDLRIEGEISVPNESASRATEVDATGKLKSSATTSTELGYLSGVTSAIQTQINDAVSDAGAAQSDATQALADAAAAQADIDNHLSDSADAHDASAISNVPAGNLAATDVQAALNELQGDIDTNASGLSNHLSDATDAHDASAISSVPAGNLAATDVQGALDELQSDVDTRALDSAVIKKNGSVAFTANQSMGGFNLTAVATPTAPTHAANKEYVDNAIEGAKPKQAVRAATTANVNLASALENGDIIDGVTLVTGDRVLVKNQSAPEDNGIYVVPASGAASRSTDFDSLSPIDEVNKAYVAVQEGTANQGKIFIQYGNVATLGTDPVNFTFYNSVSSLVGDDGITVSGSSIAVDHDGQGLTFSGGQLALELDGTTLSKSASGVRVSAATITSISDAQADATQALADAAAAQADIDNHIGDTADAHDASAISNTPSGNLTSTDVQGALNELQSEIDTLASNTALNNHINDTSDAHDASAISNVPAGNLAATDVQAALNELQGDIDTNSSNLSNHLSDSSDAHDASAISFVPTGNTTSTDVQAAIVEIQTELDNFNPGSDGDLNEGSFAAANNQASAANVTGLAFANGVVRSFEILASVYINATANSYETFKMLGIQKGASWSMAVEAVGDNTGVTFSITNAGQIQYTSTNVAGFVSSTIKFRAITTSV
jgi:hypothetical protein